MVGAIPSGACVICEVERQILLGTSEHWYWIASLSPYWRYHTMFISKVHKEDINELTPDEFTDFQVFYTKVKQHLLSLSLLHVDGKPVDQFILMVRIREEDVPGGSTYPKPKHLHLHFVPDREGVERFLLDDAAIAIDIRTIALI